jgi:hypothetical protein
MVMDLFGRHDARGKSITPHAIGARAVVAMLLPGVVFASLVAAGIWLYAVSAREAELAEWCGRIDGVYFYSEHKCLRGVHEVRP